MNRFLFTILIAAVCCAAAEPAGAEQSVRRVLESWDAAYRALDARALAELATPDFELVNRLGQWTPFSSREDSARMWAWGFSVIYQGKPGPAHTIERVRLLAPGVAVAQTRAFWADPIVLPNGYKVPPHGEIDTFVVVQRPEGWRVASENIHNQMPGDELPDPLPWAAR